MARNPTENQPNPRAHPLHQQFPFVPAAIPLSESPVLQTCTYLPTCYCTTTYSEHVLEEGGNKVSLGIEDISLALLPFLPPSGDLYLCYTEAPFERKLDVEKCSVLRRVAGGGGGGKRSKYVLPM